MLEMAVGADYLLRIRFLWTSPLPSGENLPWIGVVVFVLILAWFTAPNPIDTSNPDDPFVGRWLINGSDPFGTEYSGSLDIQRAGDGYVLEWIITGALVSGTGVRDGDELAAEWRRFGGDIVVTGTARYRVDEAGELVGTIRVPDRAENGHEQGERVG